MELENVICSTPEEFSNECQKWAGKSVIRGRKLIAYGVVVAELKSARGGYRENAGRKETGRNIPILVRISKESKEFLDTIPNKSEYIDNLLIEKKNEGSI